MSDISITTEKVLIKNDLNYLINERNKLLDSTNKDRKYFKRALWKLSAKRRRK